MRSEKRRNRLSIGVIALIILSSLAVSPALAKTTPNATIQVKNTNDSGPGSLRDAITGASSGDTITFSLTTYPATITLSSTLSINTSLTISGPGATNLAISGNHAVRVFLIAEGTIVNISGITVEFGSAADGGGILNYGTLTVNKSALFSNSATNGGGIANSDYYHALAAYRGTAQFPTLTLNESVLSYNSASVNGGGVNNFGTVIVTKSSLINNSAISGITSGGGGIANGDWSGIFEPTLTVNDSVLTHNSADAIFNPFGGVTVSNTSLSGNSGTGITNLAGHVGLSGSVISGNDAGIYNDNSGRGSLYINNSTISGNTSVGISEREGITIINNSTISGNGGDGLDEAAPILIMTNSTVADNGGWGIFDYFAAFSGVDVNNSTLSHNNSGGVSHQGVSPLTLNNTILASNGSSSNCQDDSFGSGILSAGHNISDDNSCSRFLTATGDLNNTPAGLDPGGLKNNGGPTQTIALLTSSPAIDGIPLSFCKSVYGTPIATDQRGIPRPQGLACDVGAYEYAITTPAPTSGSNCNGVYNGTFSGNINVLLGQNCIFLNGGVTGNVQQTGGNLMLLESRVGGNVQVNGGGTFTIGPGSTINGNLEIQSLPSGAGEDQVCGTAVHGNLQVQNNGTAVLIGGYPPIACTGNTIGGDLTVQSDYGATSVVGNTVGGNLTDQSNTGPTQVFNNTVSRNLSCQNDTAIQGGGNVVNQQKQGQCSGF